ncbi:hypothetical protein D3C72_1720870 [compost metagenome]
MDVRSCVLDALVEGDAGHLVRRRHEHGVLDEDRVGGFAQRFIADQAGAAGVDQALTGAGKRLQKRFHRCAMVAVRRVDDGIGGFGFDRQQGAVVECANDRLDAEGAQFIGTGGIADQAPHGMAFACECRGDRAADIATGARDEQLHAAALPS